MSHATRTGHHMFFPFRINYIFRCFHVFFMRHNDKQFMLEQPIHINFTEIPLFNFDRYEAVLWLFIPFILCVITSIAFVFDISLPLYESQFRNKTKSYKISFDNKWCHVSIQHNDDAVISTHKKILIKNLIQSQIFLYQPSHFNTLFPYGKPLHTWLLGECSRLGRLFH